MNRLLISTLALLLSLAGCSRQQEQKKVEAAAAAEPIPVRTAVAEMRLVERSIPVTGALFPDESVTVSAEVAGRVSAIYFDFGQVVRKGQVIAELDKRELSLQLERARASLNQALARVGLTPKQEEATPESTPSIRQAQAQLEDARFKFENAQRLFKTGDISKERFTELEKAYTSQQAVYEATRDELRTQLASIDALRAEVRLAEKRLDDATVRAPFDGSVAQKHVSPGQYTKDNTPIVTLVKTSPMRLRLEVPETATANLRLGTSLTFTTDAALGIEFHATVRELNPSLDPKSRSLTAEARLQENDNRLRPGMFVQVRLITDKQAHVVAVPKEALFTVAGLTKVFTVNGGRIKEHKLVPGSDLGGWIEVPGDQVRPGDRVAVSRLTQLVNGTQVREERAPAPKG